MADESMSLSEFLRSFRDDVKDEFSEINAKLNAFVLREVYLADKAANEARLSRLESDNEQNKKDKKTKNNLAIAAIYGGIGTLVGGIILAVLFGMK